MNKTTNDIDFGYANGWGDETPELVKACDHPKQCADLNTRGTLTRISCKICGYTYLVDSSD